VQHAGVGAAGDDGGVGRRLRAIAAEFVQQFRFQFVFVQAGPRGAHGAHVGRAEMAAARASCRSCVLQQAHGVQQRQSHARWRAA
jgi:hypothetical protein